LLPNEPFTQRADRLQPVGVDIHHGDRRLLQLRPGEDIGHQALGEDDAPGPDHGDLHDTASCEPC
jgi:hypothetical protein